MNNYNPKFDEMVQVNAPSKPSHKARNFLIFLALVIFVIWLSFYFTSVKSLENSKDEMTLYVRGASEAIEVTILPDYARKPEITWVSSDENIATVNNAGEVSPVSEGTAIITAQTPRGSRKAETVVNVLTIPVTSVSIDDTSTSEVFINGEQIVLTATVLPNDASYNKVTWQSSNSDILLVDDNGSLTAKEPGEVTIKVSSEDGKLSDEISLMVKPIVVTGIELSPEQDTVKTTDTMGNYFTVTISPENATNKNITWKSSNTKVATVTKSGVIKPIAVGQTKITVTTEDGKITAAATLKVVKPPKQSTSSNSSSNSSSKPSSSSSCSITTKAKDVYYDCWDSLTYSEKYDFVDNILLALLANGYLATEPNNSYIEWVDLYLYANRDQNLAEAMVATGWFE